MKKAIKNKRWARVFGESTVLEQQCYEESVL